jgi:hypothetical protein
MGDPYGISQARDRDQMRSGTVSEAISRMSVEHECSECSEEQDIAIWPSYADDILHSIGVRDMRLAEWDHKMKFMEFMDHLLRTDSREIRELSVRDLLEAYCGNKTILREHSSAGPVYHVQRSGAGPSRTSDMVTFATQQNNYSSRSQINFKW